jgi:hypothetical protein
MGRTTRLTVWALALVTALALCPEGRTAPAPAPDLDRAAKARLEALKKRLPGMLSAWVKRWPVHAEAEPRLVRPLGGGEAKVTVLLHAVDGAGRRRPWEEEVFSLYLRYNGARWTATRFVAPWPTTAAAHNRAVHLLMLALDESEEG